MKKERCNFLPVLIIILLPSFFLICGCVSFQLYPEEVISDVSEMQDESRFTGTLSPKVNLILHDSSFPGSIPDNTQTLGEAIILSGQDIQFTSSPEADYFLVVGNIFVDQGSKGTSAIHEGIITWVLIDKSTRRIFGSRTQIIGTDNVGFWSASGAEKTRLAMVDYYQKSISEGLNNVQKWLLMTSDTLSLPKGQFTFLLPDRFGFNAESLLEIGYLVASCSNAGPTWHEKDSDVQFVRCVKEQFGLSQDEEDLDN